MRRGALLALIVAVSGCGGAHARPRGPAHVPAQPAAHVPPVARPHVAAPTPPFEVAERTLRLVDRSRHIRLPGGAVVPRTLLTYVRYPRAASCGPLGVQPRHGRAALASSGCRFPLVVFGHGFTQTPAPYSALLEYWARAGYVVAAPVFPLENANAPGGPDENDLVNQPADMSFVISRLLAAHGLLGTLVDRMRIGVAGHSDGGETALAVAYDAHDRDPRVRAAVILSGAKIPGVGGFDFPAGSPPLLATQGTSDTINPPSFTFDFYDAARRPKYLLKLLGAPHLPPYTGEQPQLGVVERVTTAFLDRYLKDSAGAARRLWLVGNVPGVAVLDGQP